MIQFIANIVEDEGYVRNIYSPATSLRGMAEAERVISPNAFWRNQVTYVAGQGADSQNNAPVIFAWKNEQEVYQSNVGISDNFDTLRHDWPAIWVLPNDKVYVFYIDGHGYEMNIYESNIAGFPDNITGGFSLLHSIPGTFGYVVLQYFESERIMQVTSRMTNAESPDEHAQIVLHSAPNDLTSWTVITTTTLENSAYWHYPGNLFHYGINEYKYIGLTLRRQPELNYFSHAVYKTKDYQNYYNKDLSFGRNINEGKFTALEINNQLTTVGGDVQNYVSGFQGIVIYDTIYTSYFKTSDSKWYLRKIDPSGRITDKLLNVSDAPSSPTVSSFNYIQFFYNGINLVILTLFGKRNVYACDLNFNQFQFKEEIKWEDGNIAGGIIPQNFNNITGDYIIAGGSNEVINYLITNEKFTIGILDPTEITITNPIEGQEVYAGYDLYITVKLS